MTGRLSGQMWDGDGTQDVDQRYMRVYVKRNEIPKLNDAAQHLSTAWNCVQFVTVKDVVQLISTWRNDYK